MVVDKGSINFRPKLKPPETLDTTETSPTKDRVFSFGVLTCLSLSKGRSGQPGPQFSLLFFAHYHTG